MVFFSDRSVNKVLGLLRLLPDLSTRTLLLLFLSVFLGHLVAFLAVNLLGITLVMHHAVNSLWYFGLSPVIESWVFNFLLQQGLHDYLKRKMGYSQFVSNGFSLIFMSVCFVLLHIYVVGLMGIYWFLPALVLGMIWLTSQNLLLVALLHASWNASLAWFSSQG